MPRMRLCQKQMMTGLLGMFFDKPARSSKSRRNVRNSRRKIFEPRMARNRSRLPGLSSAFGKDCAARADAPDRQARDLRVKTCPAEAWYSSEVFMAKSAIPLSARSMASLLGTNNRDFGLPAISRAGAWPERNPTRVHDGVYRRPAPDRSQRLLDYAQRDETL
jgi:hypothetical protein